MKIKSFWGDNVNPHYNPATSNNGGGYYQPCGGAVVDLGNGVDVVVEVYDLSCGDFGRRVSYLVETAGFRWGWNYSTMDGEYSDSPDTIDATIDSIGGVLHCDAVELLDLVTSAIDVAVWHSLCREDDDFCEGEIIVRNGKNADEEM